MKKPKIYDTKMIKPELFDVIELLIDLPELEIKAGELSTIVEDYPTSK